MLETQQILHCICFAAGGRVPGQAPSRQVPAPGGVTPPQVQAGGPPLKDLFAAVNRGQGQYQDSRSC